MKQLRPISAAVEADLVRTTEATGENPRRRPPGFITIARQAWAGGSTLMQRLVERLNVADAAASGDRPWRGYDRELIENVAREYGLTEEQVDSIADQPYSFMDDLLRGFAAGASPTELTLERRIARTIYDTARAGRAVIVGRGGVFVTHNLPGGVHLYLVAPFDDRVERLAQQRGMSFSDAADEVRRIDKNRDAFYRRHFPDVPIRPDLFTLTLNTRALDEAAMTDVILRLVLAGIPVETQPTP